MKATWYTGRALGDRAKSIIDHANAGIGYFIIEQGKQGNQQTCLYAFLRADDSPAPEHLTKVTDRFMLKKLNDRDAARHGTIKRPEQRPTAPIQEVMTNRKDIFS